MATTFHRGRVLAYTFLLLAAAVCIWNIAATTTRRDVDASQRFEQLSAGGYNDQIRLPVEAFGARWRIKNFRKNVLFPDGFDEAFPRALAAVELLGRPVTITIAPRTYTLKKTMYFPNDVPWKIEGSGSKTELK